MLTRSHRPKISAIDAVWLILFAAPFTIYFYYIYRYALNVPVWDDYDSMLQPINSILTSSTISEKLANLFSQHNIHRNTFTKFLLLCQYYLTGNVNFRTLIFTSVSAYVVLVIILVWKLKTLGGTKYQLLPIPYILLALSQYENMTFFSAGGTFYWNELFVLLTILLLDSRKYLQGSILYVLAIFTNAGGLALYPIANAFLFLQKSKKKFILFAISSTLATGLFFYKFILPPSKSLTVDLKQLITYYFMFLGNVTILKSSHIIQYLYITTGIFIACLLMMIAFKSIAKSAFFTLTALWILALALFTAISRSNMGIVQALFSRYTIYSLLGVTCIYMWGIITVNEKYPALANRITMVSITLSVLFFSITIWQAEAANVFRDANIRAFGNLFIAAEYPVPATKPLKEADTLGVYKFVPSGLQARPPAEVLSAAPVANRRFRGSLDFNNKGIYLRGWAFIPNQNSFPSRIFLILKKDRLILKLQTTKYERPDVSLHFSKPGLYDYSGYEAYPGAYNIPSGTYSFGILVENKEYTAFQWQENETVVIP